MKTFEEIEQYAKDNFVPIARKDFVAFLQKLVVDNNYTDILEIGSAIGYTTINLALLDNVYVTTIEHDLNRYDLCIENIKNFNVENKVSAINDDALTVFISQKFDLIFIDAAKAKNILFFEKYRVNLNDNGIIIIDNMYLNDFKQHVSMKKRVFYEQKINELKEYLNKLTDFDVSYLPIGDGIAFLKKK